MTFFNRKEEVIDIELTQYGKLLLAKGMFKPKKYAFFDDDVIYDAQYMTPTDATSVSNPIAENQNDASTRIKESVRSRAQYDYGDTYSLAEIEEGEQSVLMSVSVKNHVGFETFETIEVLQAATVEYKYINYKQNFPNIKDWIPWMLAEIGSKIKGGKSFYSELGGGNNTDVGAVVPNSTEFKVEVKGEPKWSNELQKWVGTDPIITVIKYYSMVSGVKSFPVYETNFESTEFGKGRREFDHDIYYEGMPLGSAELKNQKLPAWNILSLNQKELGLRSLTLDLMAAPPGNKELDDFNTKYYTYGNLPIPQISSDIKIRTLLDDSKTINDLEEDIVESQAIMDGLTLRVKNDYLLLVIDEKNTYFENENFSIEVFEMENNTKLASATFIVSGVGSLSNGQTIKFTTWDGSIYNALTDSSVAKADSTKTIIGTSDVSTNTHLAEAISNSIKSFNLSLVNAVAGVTTNFNAIPSTSNEQFIIDQAVFIEVVTKDTAVQGTLFTANVLTSLVNWEEGQTSKTLKRLYFTEDPSTKGSSILYSPKEAQEISSIPVSETHVGYYMNVFVDEEIDSELFRKYQDRLKNLRNDKLLTPKGSTKSNIIDIYGDDAEDVGEIC